ncbi:MAG: lytic murein transglycosylase [bacterium]
MNKYKNFKLILVFALVVPVFVAGQVSFWQDFNLSVKAADVVSQGPDQGAIKDTQGNISDVQKQLEKKLKLDATLNKNLGQIKQSVSVVQKDISKTQTVIKNTVEDISRKEAEVINLNNKIQLQKSMLRGLLQQMYYNQGQPILNVVLTSSSLTEIFSDTDHLLTIEDKIKNVSQQIVETKSQVEQDKIQLAEVKQQHEEILDTKVDQKQGLVADQIDTQKTLADNQKTIDKLKKELSQLQGDLNTLLGKSYSAKNIMDAVDFASSKTDVPKGFLIGVLKMETNLGANVGGCTYGQVESGAEASYKSGKLGKTAWNTFLGRRETFKGITKELGLDYQKQKVSCNPKGYTGTGGAMGVAQFMPDTWNAYKSQVSSITGNHPASPWDLGDGVMAMALKLGRVPGVTAGKTSAMKSAACSYLGTCYAPYINGILYWADNYKSLL